MDTSEHTPVLNHSVQWPEKCFVCRAVCNANRAESLFLSALVVITKITDLTSCSFHVKSQSSKGFIRIKITLYQLIQCLRTKDIGYWTLWYEWKTCKAEIKWTISWIAWKCDNIIDYSLIHSFLPAHYLWYEILQGLHPLPSHLLSVLKPLLKTLRLCFPEDIQGSTVTDHHFHTLK